MAILNGRNSFKGKDFERLFRALHGDSADRVLTEFTRKTHTSGRFSITDLFGLEDENLDKTTLRNSGSETRSIATPAPLPKKKRSLPSPEEEQVAPRKKQRRLFETSDNGKSSERTVAVPTPIRGTKRPLQDAEGTSSPKRKRPRILNFDNDEIGHA